MEKNPLLLEKDRSLDIYRERAIRGEDPIKVHGREWLWISLAITVVMLVILVLWTLVPITTISIVMLSTLVLLALAAFLYTRRLSRLDRPVRRR